MIKVNRIVGFIPLLYTDKELQTEVQALVNYTKGEAYFIGAGLKEATKLSITDESKNPPPVKNKEGKLPLVCWAKPSNEEKAQGFKLAFPEDENLHYFSLWDFPYMGQVENPGASVPLILHYDHVNRAEIEKSKIKIECRVMAKNIPFDYMVDLLKTSQHGHTSFVAKTYDDKDKVKLFWKMDKDKEM